MFQEGFHNGACQIIGRLGSLHVSHIGFAGGLLDDRSGSDRGNVERSDLRSGQGADGRQPVGQIHTFP